MDNQQQNLSVQSPQPVSAEPGQSVQPTGMPMQQPVQSVSPVQQQVPLSQPQQPNEPISVGRSKEMLPMPSNEWVSSSTPEEVVLPPEVEAAGVEAKPVVPVISQQLQQMGVQTAKEMTPVTTVQAEPVTMKTPRSVLEQLKQTHKKVTEGFSWLVRLIIKEQDKKEKGASL